MKKTIVLSILAILFCLSAQAQTPSFNANQTFEFDPNNIGGVYAKWLNGTGETDLKGRSNFGLVLQKNVPTSTVASAGAFLTGLEGTIVQTGDRLGFDYQINGSVCNGGAARFNVIYTFNGEQQLSFVGGCGVDDGATQLGNGFVRVRFELQNPGEAFPVIPVGAVIEAVYVVVDEQGQYVLDNLRFNNQVADKPGKSTTVAATF